ncbi:MAG: hypothetical protein HY953_02885 [Candidatus Rokubacteria bacterium]|nr:hypothetical protein [Candidatus Rokubacteria bacterium]
MNATDIVASSFKLNRLIASLVLLALAGARPAVAGETAASGTVRTVSAASRSAATALRTGHQAAASPNPECSGREETGAGFVLGPIGGIGFTYRHFGEDGMGWQVGGLAIGGRRDATVIFGAQMMHTLKVRARSRFYTTLGALHTFESDATTNIGGGLGISWGESEGVTYCVELPLVLHFRDGFDFDGLGPIQQVALVYNF